jgi:hypothetical protein
MPFFLLAACSATPPAPPEKYAFDNSRAYDESIDQIWDHLNEYFLVKHFEVSPLDKANGKIHATKVVGYGGGVNEDANLGPNGIADCGRLGFGKGVPQKTSLSIDVVVIAEGTKTKVTINAAYEQERGDCYGFGDCYRWQVRCTSTGGLEQEILNSL